MSGRVYVSDEIEDVRVWTTDGDEEGRRFRYEDLAQNWLEANGYRQREDQPGEWVKLLDSGNMFASVRPDRIADWQPNYGKR